MTAPPPYPRVPHLIAERGSRDDVVLGDSEVSNILAAEVVVEEKVDGANVVVSKGGSGQIDCALRSGLGAMDRAGQLGPLRAWLAIHDEEVRAALDGWPVLYGEWLLVAHSIVYDRLPAYLVVLDLWRPVDGFAGVEQRNETATEAGLSAPPELWRGVPGSLPTVEALLGSSTWGACPMEGVVVRRLGVGEPRLAKLVRAEFDRIDDQTWQAGRPRNRLAEGKLSWH